MHYPWWHVPFITAPMLIAAVAVIHVYVAMYAVGGGMYLAVETSFAYRTRNHDYLAYLKKHTWFFILLTVVFGAITGVGIWWTIGLASPLATETLIHTFVFGWAMEYVFFVIEIASAFIFFYYWDRLPPKTHETIGWIYAVSAWFSLLIITAITSFMLHPGGWLDNQTFWVAFWNPQTLPQTLARTGGSLLLATLYVFLHASTQSKDNPDLLHLIESRSARPGLIGAVMVTAGGVWWFLALPESARAALAAASALNIMMAIIFAATIVVFAMLYFGPYRNPGWVTYGFALLLFSFGLVAVGAGEFVREAVRKPFIIYNVTLGNQIFPDEIATTRQNGYLESGVWTSAYIATHYPQVVDAQGHIDEAALLDLPEADRVQVGEVLFQYHCNDCHTGAVGYSAMGQLLQGWSKPMIRDLVEQPEKVRFFMPPFAGTPEEADLLTDYLYAVARPFPGGMVTGSER